MPKTKTQETFSKNVTALRQRTYNHIQEGAITPNYGIDSQKTIALLQNVLATEVVCVLRYTMHAIAAEGINSEAISREFQEHADEERMHMMKIAERIDQLGGIPDFNPEGLADRSATEYGHPQDLVEMIKDNLIAERVVIEHYRDLIRYFGNDDPTTRVMLEAILATEEDHANEMHDLLISHEGRPFLNK